MSPKSDASQIGFDLLFKNHPLPMWIYDIPSLAFLEVNDAAVKKYGYSRKKFLTLTLKDIRPKEDVSRLVKDVSKKRPALQQSKNWRHKLKSGKIIDVEITSHTIDYNGGKAVFVTAKDITDRKRTEKALRKSEENLSITLNSIGDAVISTDNKGIIINMNPTAGKLCGWKMYDAIGKPIDKVFKIINANSRIAIDSPFDKVIKTGKVIGLANHTILVSRDGTERNISDSAAPIKDSNENIKGVVLVFSDVTEAYKTRKELHDSEQLLRESQKIARLGSYVWDLSTGSWSSSKILDDIFGIDETYIRSLEGWAALVHPDWRETITKYVTEKVIGKRKRFDKEYKIVRIKDGEERWVHGLGELELDNKKQPVRLKGTISDITERKRAEEALRERKIELRAILESTADGILAVDNNGKVIKTNSRFSDLWRIPQALLNLGDNEALLTFVLDQLINPEEFLNKVYQLYNSKDKDFDTLYFKDGRVFERFSTPLIIENKISGRVWSFRDITERKQAEEELRKSREDLLKFFEDDISADFIATPSGKLLQCNRTFLELFGFKSTEEALAFPIEKLYSVPSDINRFIDLLKKNKKIANFEGELLSLDGRIIYTIENSVAEFDDAGELIQIRGYIVDITKRKKAEEELKKLSRVVEQSPASVIITNQDGDIEYVNEKFCEVTGYSNEEVFGKNPRILKSNHHDKNFYADLWSSLLSGRDWKGEMLNKKKNGELFWESVLLSPLLNNEGDITNFVAVKEDITERKQREEEIVMLANAFKSVNECVSITDIEDNIIFINQSFAKTYGYSESELIGRHISNFRSPNNPQILIDEILPSTLRGGWQGELWNKRKDGSEFLIYLSTRIINDKDGKLIGLIGVASDITERKATEQELIKAKELADQSNRLKDAFIANMSHEIRTPLNGILGLSGIIKEMYAEHIKEEDEQLFAGIELSSKRIIRTIDMILNYSRIQTGEFPVSHRKIELSSICDNLVKEFTTSAKSKLLKLSFENRYTKTISIFADEYSITHAISNLIDNAIKYTNKGFIDVILYNGKDDDIMLDVKDSGIGISEDYIQHIFEPYQQEQMGYGRAYEGVGLGLPMAKKFLLLNNAGISVKSTKEKGTVFTVNFGKPIYPSEEKKITEKFIDNIASSERKSIPLVLIVEDDKINQSTIERFIEKSFRSISTDSSDETIELLKNNKVDLILVDFSIKGSMNGLELTKELKASKEYSGIPVIAITAHAFESDRYNALEAGCDDYLSKPFSKNSLLETIGKFI